jgi:cell division initiation protein
MDVTPQELRDSDIKPAFRGYDPDAVNELLDRAASTIETQNEKIRLLTERLSSAQNTTTERRETEDLLHKTLLLAQRAADEAIGEAQEKARGIVAESEQSARGMIAEAELEVRRIADVEKRRVEEEIVELAGRRDALIADVRALEQWEADYRRRVVRQIEGDLEAVRGRDATEPAPQPTLTDVELPEGVLRRTEAPTQPLVIDTSAPRRDTSPMPTPAPVSEAPAAPVPATATAGAAPTASATAPAAAAPTATTAPAEETAIDLEAAETTTNGGDLDDDEFFATLREAVRDDAPLDSLGTNDSSLFEDDNEPSFREMFRRRR